MESRQEKLNRLKDRGMDSLTELLDRVDAGEEISSDEVDLLVALWEGMVIVLERAQAVTTPAERKMLWNLLNWLEKSPKLKEATKNSVL